ncbi:MAG: tetratricopeptide repeat protein [Candidatus Xenobiia bacterium LiM19]
MQRIDISRVNMVLFGVLICMVIAFHNPLWWAIQQLPRYLRGQIDAPLEIRQCNEASAILRNGSDASRALPLLQRSAAVDPHSEALFWLGEYYCRKGEPDKAIPLFTRYRRINTLDGATCLRLAKLYEERGESEKACGVLKEGLESLDCRRDYEPCIDGTVDDRYNRKAGETFKALVESGSLMEQELKRLKALKKSSIKEQYEKQEQVW